MQGHMAMHFALFFNAFYIGLDHGEHFQIKDDTRCTYWEKGVE